MLLHAFLFLSGYKTLRSCLGISPYFLFLSNSLFFVFADKWPLTSTGLPSTAGTTASIAFIRKGKIYIGHVGDSGIVLGQRSRKGIRWNAKHLTIDHKPESPSEKARIESCGGVVQQKFGVSRVVWNRPKRTYTGPVTRGTHVEQIPFLAVARSLGDLWSYNSRNNTFVVSPEPDVSVEIIDVQNYKCLIFASDGVWNMMDPRLAIDKVYETETYNRRLMHDGGETAAIHWRNPSRVLVEHTLNLWKHSNMRADNTSVVCVMLDSPEQREQLKLHNTVKMVNECVLDPDNLDDEQMIVDYSINQQFQLEHFTQYNMYTPGALQRHNASYDLLADMKRTEEANQFNTANRDLTSGNSLNNYHYTPNLDTHNLHPPMFPSGFHHSQYPHNQHHQQASEGYSSGYESYDYQNDYQMASTSSNSDNYHHDIGVTYQSTNYDNGFTKSNCTNSYVLTNLKTIHQQQHHTYYDQASYYEPLNERSHLPPLHYRFRYVRNPQNLERFEFMPFTEEELDTFEEEEKIRQYQSHQHVPDTDVDAFSDEDDSSLSAGDIQQIEKNGQSFADDVTEKILHPQQQTCDDSVQIHEISSSCTHKPSSDADTDYEAKPNMLNDKENSGALLRKKKTFKIRLTRKFYETRQNGRSLRSGIISTTSTGTFNKIIGREKAQRRAARAIRQNVKFEKFTLESIKKMQVYTEKAAKNKENKPEEKCVEPVARVLRKSHIKHTAATTTTKLSELAPVSRSLRSNNNDIKLADMRMTRKRASTVISQNPANRIRLRKLK